MAALYDWPRSPRKYRKSLRIFREPWHPVPDSERLPLKFGGMSREPAIDYWTCFAPYGDSSSGDNGRGLSQAKGGSGGRIDALEELHKDGVPLVGVDVSGAFLQGIDLSGANLLRANFRAADVRGGNFRGAQMEYIDLASANFRDATLQKADLRNANLQDADLTGANFSEADLEGTDLSKADLRNADFRNAKWQKIADVKLANVFGVKNAPADFLNWAMQNGAVSKEADTEWQALLTRE